MVLQLQLWTNGALEEHLPATTFGAPASSTAGHVGWREVACNNGTRDGILNEYITNMKTKTLNATNIKRTKTVNLIDFIECQPLKISE